MKQLGILMVLSLALLCCSSTPRRSEDIRGSYESNIRTLDLNNSFAFSVGADHYYFARIFLRNEDYDCPFLVGFRNDEFRYSFPQARMVELADIYYMNLSLNAKRDLALKRIDAFQKEDHRCRAENGYKRTGSTAGDVVSATMYLLIFGPVLPLGMVFGADHIIREVQDAGLQSRLARVRLGMTYNEIEQILNRKLVKTQTGQYEYYYLDYTPYGTQRFVAVFENQRLTGMLRGYRDQREHQK